MYHKKHRSPPRFCGFKWKVVSGISSLKRFSGGRADAYSPVRKAALGGAVWHRKQTGGERVKQPSSSSSCCLPPMLSFHTGKEHIWRFSSHMSCARSLWSLTHQLKARRHDDTGSFSWQEMGKWRPVMNARLAFPLIISHLFWSVQTAKQTRWRKNNGLFGGPKCCVPPEGGVADSQRELPTTEEFCVCAGFAFSTKQILTSYNFLLQPFLIGEVILAPDHKSFWSPSSAPFPLPLPPF